MKARAQKMKEAKTAKPMVKKRTGPIVSKPVAIVSDINELKEEAVMLEKQALEAAKKENELRQTGLLTASRKWLRSKRSWLFSERRRRKSKGELEKAVAERSKLATKAQAMKDVIENHEAMEARKRQVRELEEKGQKAEEGSR
jgi:hypothetical protein